MHHFSLRDALSGPGLPWYSLPVLSDRVAHAPLNVGVNLLALSPRLEHRPPWAWRKHPCCMRPTLSPRGAGPENRPPRGLVVLPALLVCRTQERFHARPGLRSPAGTSIASLADTAASVDGPRSRPTLPLPIRSLGLR